MITFQFRRQIESANKFVNRMGGMGGTIAYRKDRDGWAIMIRAARIPPVIAPKRKVWCELHSYRISILDDANLVGGAKGMIDSFKRLGWLHDDRPAFFHCEYIQHKAARACGPLTVLLYDVTPPTTETR